MAGTPSSDVGEQLSSPEYSKKGGWIAFPFIIATMAGLSLGTGGLIANLIVYLIGEFNMKSIDAAQVYNVVNGCTTMFPIIGAVIADSFLGCFSVIWVSSLISVLGAVLLTLVATVDSLRPQPCDENGCTTPSATQFAVLYLALALVSLGLGGTRYTAGTLGADQFNNSKQQGVFFNWFIFTMYTATVISFTAVVYVQDNISWGLGFGICVAANVVGSTIFLAGSRFYRRVKPQGSPFTGLARVLVAAVRKNKLLLSSKSDDYCQDHSLEGATRIVDAIPTKAFRFLNYAALKSEGDISPQGSIAKPWKLCTVQQVEDLKILIKIIPLWSTGLFLCTPLALQTSLVVLQALTMDRHLGPHFKIPAGSMLVFILLSTSITLIFIDRFLFPIWEKLTHQPLSPLRRIGVGHVLTLASMVLSAMVESRRLKIAQSHNLHDHNGATVSMSVTWLVPQLAIAGIGEAFHFPGQIALYYQEFPTTLKGTSTAMVAMFIGIAFYLSNALINLLQKVTDWLPDDINHGRLDNIYWVCAWISGLNFIYFLLCSWMYKYQHVEKSVDKSSS